MAMGDRPEPRHDHEHERIDHDRVRHGEEAELSRPVQERRYGDERVRGVQVAADRKPADERAECPAPQPPLIEARQRLRAPPAHRREAETGYEHEQGDEDAEFEPDDVRVVLHGIPVGSSSAGRPAASARFSSKYAIPVTTIPTMIHSNWNQ